jgi:hypothetical protein
MRLICPKQVATSYRVCPSREESSPNTYVMWLHASNTARFKQSFSDVLDQLKVPGRAEPSANIYQLFRTWLREAKAGYEWLLILDKADDSEFLIMPSDETARSQDQSETDNDSGDRCIDYLR